MLLAASSPGLEALTINAEPSEMVAMDLLKAENVVRSCPRLVSFQPAVRKHHYTAPLPSLGPPVLLASLESFVIFEEVEPLHVEVLLRQLRMLQLRRLEVPRTF
jgi:hypothetical protein